MTSPLIGLLKKKGTGPTMSKSLDADELAQISVLMGDSDIPLVTKTTLLTAILQLEATDAEQTWIDACRANSSFLPASLRWLVSGVGESEFQRSILRIMDGEPLSQAEASLWMNELFNPSIPNHLKAAFLEALRLRRETEVENKAALSACLERTRFLEVDLPVVVDIANAYDGFSRSPYLTPFVASVLAACNVAVSLHGMDEVSPKRGLNTRKILECAGKLAVRPSEMVRDDIHRVGWTYSDQSLFCPELFALKPLRIEMVKRPIIATVEKMVLPVRGAKTMVVTGYTHPPYKGKTVMLLGQLPIVRGVIVRGLEGSTQLPLNRRAPQIIVDGASVLDDFIRPQDLGLPGSDEKCDDFAGISATQCLEMGVSALGGTQGIPMNLIRYQAAQILHATQLSSDPLRDVDRVIQSGDALSRWDALK